MKIADTLLGRIYNFRNMRMVICHIDITISKDDLLPGAKYSKNHPRRIYQLTKDTSWQCTNSFRDNGFKSAGLINVPR